MMWNSVWLELYLVSFGANILIALQMVAGRWIGRRLAIQSLSALLAVCSILILTVDGINLLNEFQFRNLQPWGYFPLLGVAIGLSWLSIRTLCFAKSTFEIRSLNTVLAVVLVMLNCWSWQRLNEHQMDRDFSVYEHAPGTIVAETKSVAFTKTGSTVQLYRLEADPEDFSRFAASVREHNSRVAEPIIDVEEPSKDYNCHGWVFTGGKHFLRGCDVDLILKDNGYQAISQPKENDIVIYRCADGRILHTGLVRVVLVDGTILIESKWGAAGRYLHRPENQPYSTLFEYYRGCSASHLIQLKDLPSSSTKELPSKIAAFGS